MWLLSKHRDKSALKSLQWLRGWVPARAVQTEFDAIKRYKDSANSCDECKQKQLKCIHPAAQSAAKMFKEMIQRKTLEPFAILMIIGVATFFTGTHHIFAYMAPILKTYKAPINPNVALVS